MLVIFKFIYLISVLIELTAYKIHVKKLIKELSIVNEDHIKLLIIIACFTPLVNTYFAVQQLYLYIKHFLILVYCRLVIYYIKHKYKIK